MCKWYNLRKTSYETTSFAVIHLDEFSIRNIYNLSTEKEQNYLILQPDLISGDFRLLHCITNLSRFSGKSLKFKIFSILRKM